MEAATASITGSQTIAALIPRAAAEHAEQVAVRYKRDGAWQDVSYTQLAEIVQEVGCRIDRALRHTPECSGLRVLYKGQATVILDRAKPLRTIAAAREGGRTVVAPPLIERNEAAKPEEIVEWLETVVTVQKAGDREAFFKQAAEALVEKIGLDSGIVLIKDGDAWRVMALPLAVTKR